MEDSVQSKMSTGNQTTEETYTMIRQAIIDKDVVVASYRGYIREMCPHLIGTKGGHARALFYQFAGRSTSGLKPDGSPSNWRCLRLDELSGAAIRKSKGEWHTASNYSAMQACVDEVDIKVDLG